MTWPWGLLLGLSTWLLVGCTHRTPMERAEALMRLGIAHCLYVQGAVPPYGSAHLWARFGDMDCEAIWAAHRGAVMP
jgi:hypothetical protein